MPTTIRATKPAILIASLLLTTGFAVAGPAAAMADDTVQTRGAALPTSICANNVDSYIYQDVATTPGAVYTWHLDHAARNAGTPDSMQVMIGTPGHETAQQATRVASNDPADKVGKTSDTITTHGTGQSDGWSTYEGVYVATSTVTRFTFKAVTGQEAYGSAEGNLIDDIGFEISWPLTYDLQGGQGLIPNKEQQS